MAYATNRTLILNTVGWRYSQKGWDSVFLPLSKTCVVGSDANAQAWRGTRFLGVSKLFYSLC